MKYIFLILTCFILSCTNANAPCQDSTMLLEASWTGQQGYTCPHPQHVMKTEPVGLTKSSVQVTCTCPRDTK